ncbi:putative disease resistance protein RGA3 [Sesamum angolense]|uniref:Disease resistance protein RGA3 n=1 Tax=Sesamum angolense TaxID=2727404 RepID=A0AAE1T3Y0_9LAMI|nr:putative disease resistance protein RGA3 [Sesamum angolense]
MAEIVIDSAVQVLVEKLIAIASEEIGLILGVKKELASLKDSFTKIQAFLNDASKRQVEEEAAKLWLKDLENIAYEADNLLDEFNYEIVRRKVQIKNQMKRKVCFFFCFSNPVLFRSKLAHKIKNLNIKLKTVNDTAFGYLMPSREINSATFVPLVTETDSVTVDPIVIGREKDVSMIVDMLLSPNDEVVSVVPIPGMGGLGKTTFARLIFNDQRTRILESITNNVVQVEGREAILQQLKEELKDKRFLLVLDDLWNGEQEYWENFRSSLVGINSVNGNFIIVTTRSNDVASIVNPRYQHSLGILSDDDCWNIIKMRVFSNEEEVSEHLENIGREIARKCGGLPLAANMIGATLRRKDIHDWTSVLQSGFSDSNGDTIGVLQVLKLSFHRLPSPLLKKCFAYCSIFSEDEEIEKERLIQLWMAEGLLVEKDGDDMESLGTESFNVENHKSDPIPPRVRNLAIRSLDDHESYKMAIKENASYLRALFSNDKIPDSVLDDCKNLRTLALQENTKELSPSIAKLIHLRFIDVSFTKIRAFPESICQLYNLQTFRAFRCYKLQELPSQLRNLISLRHLVVDWENNFKMPIEIGKLTCLRTLKFFNVGNENGRRIEELGYLKNLKGEIAIHKLEHVNGKEEAARACLTEKPNIHKLKLVWNRWREGNNFNDEQVLEGLEPPPNIKSLSIEGFSGDNLPSWIMNRSISDQVIRLEKLIEFKLIGCERCLEIPALGHLPLLKFLTLRGLGNVRSIGPWFYYPRNYGVNESRRRGNNQLAFPALERFILNSMANLEEWTELSSTDSYQVVNAFPRLEYLGIYECPNITRFPSHGFPSLKELEIDDVERGGLLLDRIHNNNNSTSLTSLTLRNVLDVTCLPKRLFMTIKGLCLCTYTTALA